MMERYDAYRILEEMAEEASLEQREALDIACNDIEFVDMMPDGMAMVVFCGECDYCQKHPTSDEVMLCTNATWNKEYYPLVGLADYCSRGKRRASNEND